MLKGASAPFLLPGMHGQNPMAILQPGRHKHVINSDVLEWISRSTKSSLRILPIFSHGKCCTVKPWRIIRIKTIGAADQIPGSLPSFGRTFAQPIRFVVRGFFESLYPEGGFV
jgi:hypothetical protein